MARRQAAGDRRRGSRRRAERNRSHRQPAVGPGGGTATLDSAGVSEVNKASGDLLYIENRAPVERSNAQSEDIKVVITL